MFWMWRIGLYKNINKAMVYIEKVELINMTYQRTSRYDRRPC